MALVDESPLEIGTYGAVEPGVRRGLPSHIDGIPVGDAVPVYWQPRWGQCTRALPMVELREDGDVGPGVAACWPNPAPRHDLAGKRGEAGAV